MAANSLLDCGGGKPRVHADDLMLDHGDDETPQAAPRARPRIGSSCPTPAGRDTLRDRLSWVDCEPWRGLAWVGDEVGRRRSAGSAPRPHYRYIRHVKTVSPPASRLTPAGLPLGSDQAEGMRYSFGDAGGASGTGLSRTLRSSPASDRSLRHGPLCRSARRRRLPLSKRRHW